jgi:glucose/arabinose dehydrogenase
VKEDPKALRHALLPVTLALLAGILSTIIFANPAPAAVPTGFDDELVTAVAQPTALAFTPDGRLLVTSKPGQLRVYKNGELLQTPALDIEADVCSNSERGLLGVAVDPNFETNNRIYLYYTYKKYGVCPDHKPANPNNPVNRVSRFTMTGDIANLGSEEVLVNNIPSPNGNHNAGDLKFGKDGNLYISVGDGGCDYREPTKCQTENDASRDRHVLLGKILRITPDGGIPQGNPYTGDNSARCSVNGRTGRGKNCRETFARGLRNPFRMAFNPDAAGTSFRINDVGAATWEEIDRGKAGADYGWNIREGHCKTGSTTECGAPPEGMTNPIFDYNHNRTGCRSITGGAFVPDSASWPASFEEAYLFGDFVCNKIFKLTPKTGGSFAKTEFATGLDRGPIAMAFGPFGTGEALYYTTFAGKAGGQVRRISYVP